MLRVVVFPPFSHHTRAPSSFPFVAAEKVEDSAMMRVFYLASQTPDSVSINTAMSCDHASLSVESSAMMALSLYAHSTLRSLSLNGEFLLLVFFSFFLFISPTPSLPFESTISSSPHHRF